MSFPRRIHVVGARPGHGTTTVAVALAAHTAELGIRTALVSDEPAAIAALAGTAHIDSAVRIPLTRRLALWRADVEPDDADVVIEDVARPETPPDPRQTLIVVRGPDYLALRTAVDRPLRACGVVILSEPWRALSPADAASVLGLPVLAEVPHHAEVARAADAGLLLDRIDRLAAFSDIGRLARRGIHPAVVEAASA